MFLMIISWLIVFALDMYYSITVQKDKRDNLWYGGN